MNSKLSNKYPVADPKLWLIFTHQWQNRIDPVFAGRLAALGRDMNKKINILSGFRSREEQEESYRISLPGMAAKPGSSFHEYGVAIDTSDLWLKELEKKAATRDQCTLLKYGLFKPLTPGNCTGIFEDWHMQPIETLSICDNETKKQFFLAYMEEMQMDIAKFQMVFGMLPDGVVGAKTLAKMNEVKAFLDSQIKPETVTVKVNGADTDKGILVDGKTFIPVRNVLEALEVGAKINWDSNTKTVNIERGGK